MAPKTRQAQPAGILVEVKLGSKTVTATFAELHLSVVHSEQLTAGHGKAKGKSIQKITGMNKSTDVTLKRGVVSAPGFTDWLNGIRNGKSKVRKMVVTIPKSGLGRAARWNLKGVSITKYDGPSMNAKSNDVAIEELVLTAEGVELK